MRRGVMTERERSRGTRAKPIADSMLGISRASLSAPWGHISLIGTAAEARQFRSERYTELGV
jgi:hypothetical protein